MPTGKRTKTKKTAVASFDTPQPMESTFVAPKFVGEALASDISVSRRGRLPANFEGVRQNFSSILSSGNPFSSSATGMDVRDAIVLTRKAYWTFPLLKNTIDVMTELANTGIFLTGGNKKTQAVVGAWLNRIGIWHLKEQFFREFFRSGNFLAYRFDGELQPTDISRMTQVFGSLNDKVLPVRYVVLNPEHIRVGANISFATPQYYKVLSNYELERIRHPKTTEDKEVLKSLGAETIREIKQGTTPWMPLDPERLHAIFYKKQDYEPMGVPMAYPLLEDINAKIEMKRRDMSTMRHVDRMMLLITAGAEPTKGGINPKTLESLQTLFMNESVARTLVADYTVTGKWLVPEIDKILGEAKYAEIDRDIKEGLNAILFNGNEKFANASLKVQVLVERLKEARSAFIETFLQPEIKKVCQVLNAKNYPEARFEEINLRDDLQYIKIYAQLAQIGILSPDELLTAMESGKLPLPEENLENQKAYKEARDAGYYVPLVGGPKATEGSPLGNGAGRPSGTTAPQTTKKASPIGTSTAAFSMAKIKTVAEAAEEIHADVLKKVRRKFKIKELNESQKSVANLIVQSIMANEPMDHWKASVAEYVKTPKDISDTVSNEIDELAIAHDIDPFLASVLRLSKIDHEQQ